MEKANVIILDGVNNGFAVYLQDKKDFIRGNVIYDPKNNKKSVYKDAIKLFKNIETAKAFLNSKLNIVDPYDYKLWIFADGEEIDYDDVEYFEPYYEYYNESGVHYYIQETKVEKITHIGYFVFEDGDEKRICDPKVGLKKSKELYSYIKDAISYIVSYPSAYPGIEKVYRDSKGFLCLNIKGCTGKIHILYNSQIMNLNMDRKSNGKNCIPFNKDMDKYKSIYIFATKDISDGTTTDKDIHILALINTILEELNYNHPESNPRYREVSFNGTIINE